MFDVLAAVRENFRAAWAEGTKGDLEDRIHSSLVLLPVTLIAVILGGLWFNLLVLVAAILMSFEWQTITANIEGDARAQKRWRWRGVSYIAVAGASLLWLRNLHVETDGYHGGWVAMWMLCVVWATDIAAFFTGRSFGGPKLAPSISPSKTWSGVGGGVLAAIFIGLLFSMVSGMPGLLTLATISALASLVSQGGDLLESYIKRVCNVKDSGDLIPGHGGILDRVDGLVTAAPFVMLIFLFLGKS